MRSEPKTQREIIAALGDIPQSRRSLLEVWKSKTFENRHVALMVVIFSLVFVVYTLLGPSRRARFAGESSPGSPPHLNNPVHFTRDRPLEILIVNEVPAVESSVSEWEAMIDDWDTHFHMVVVLSTTMAAEVLERVDTLLKLRGIKGSQPWGRATWFFAAQLFPQGDGTRYYATSPRVMLTASFQSLVMGMQVELLTATMEGSAQLLKRLEEGQGDVNTRLVLVPPVMTANLAWLNQVSKLTPVMVLSLQQTTLTVRRYSSSSSSPGTSEVITQTLLAQRPCVIQPFEVNVDYRWHCRSVAADVFAVRKTSSSQGGANNQNQVAVSASSDGDALPIA